MKKIEEIINMATDGGINISITVGILLLIGYLFGFVFVKIA